VGVGVILRHPFALTCAGRAGKSDALSLPLLTLYGPAAPRREIVREYVLDLASHVGLIFVVPTQALISNLVDPIVSNGRRHDKRGIRCHSAQAKGESISCWFGFLKHGLFSLTNYVSLLSSRVRRDDA
jgi:hypothetical protein